MIKETEVRKRIGLKVKEKRLENNMTQAELAELLSVSNRHISRIENGTVGIPLKILIQLCNIFDTDPSWFFEKPGSTNTENPFASLSPDLVDAFTLIINKVK